MTRLDATPHLVAALRATSRSSPASAIPRTTLFAAGDRPANFYTWGSMGLASSIGLGLAMAQPESARLRPRRRRLAADEPRIARDHRLDAAREPRRRRAGTTSVYGTTGGQDTATAHGADLEAAARAMGVAATATVRSVRGTGRGLARTRRRAGPWVIVAKVEESTPTMKPPLDCVFIKQRFMAAIGLPEAATQRRGPA